jgi:hypothetical protein
VDIIAMEIEKKMGYSIHIFNLQHDAGDRYMNIFFTLGEKTRILKELHFFSRTKHHLTLNQIMKKLSRQKEKKEGSHKVFGRICCLHTCLAYTKKNPYT